MPFEIKNGVRQGAVLSPVLFNLYTSDLFKILSKLGPGARINSLYYGLFGYADDLALLCNSVSGLQEMLNATAKFAEEYNIEFSTNDIIAKSKTKGMMFAKKKENDPKHKMMLKGKELPWVTKIKYLGTIISNSHNKLEEDIASKRARFIDNCNSLLQEFKYANPLVKSKINTIYNGNVYGSNLYDMNCDIWKQLINSFNVATRTIWGVPRETHRYIVGELAGRHMLTNMFTNRIGFYKRLENSHKINVMSLFRTAANDLRTVTGSSLRKIRNECVELGLLNDDSNTLSLDIGQFRKSHRQCQVPENESFRISVLSDLLGLRTEYAYFEDDQFVLDDIENMIEYICVS